MAGGYEINTVSDVAAVVQEIVSGGDNLSLANYYLTTLYGDWILGGEGYTIVTSAFSVINFLAATLGAIIFFAAFTTGIARTALEGEFLGKEWGNDYMAAKMFVGVAMMMPILVDYNVSLSQRLGIQMLMMGSNAADYTWRKTVENAVVNPGMPSETQELNAIAAAFLKSATCSVAMAHSGEGELDNPLISFVYNNKVFGGRQKRGNATSVFLTDISAGGQAVAIQGIQQLFSNMQLGEGTVTRLEFGKGGNCGVYKMPPLPGRFNANLAAIDNPNDFYRNTGVEQWETDIGGQWESDEGHLTAILGRILVESGNAGYGHIRQLTQDSYSQAFDLVRFGWDNMQEALDSDIGSPGQNQLDQWTREFVENKEKFAEGVETSIKEVLEGAGPTNASWKQTIVQLAAQKGWMYAGAWVLQLGKILSIGQETVSTFTTFTPLVPKEICASGWTRWFRDENDCDTAKDIAILAEAVIERSSIHELGNVDPASVAMDCSAGECNTIEIEDSITSKVTKTLLRMIMAVGAVNNSPFTRDQNNGASVIYYDERSPTNYIDRSAINTDDHNPLTNATGTANPFATLIQLGHGFLNVAHLIEITSIPVRTAAEFTEAVGQEGALGVFSLGASIAGFTVSNIIENLLIRLFGAAILFMGLGVMLAYILPLLPLLRWLGPTIGWIIMSAEYLIMAPIAMMLLVIPEGRGILGTNLMTIIRYIGAGFLRPTLAVLALVASYVLAYVCFGFYNGIYWEAVSLNTDMSLFEVVISFYLYGYIAYQIIDKLMSLCINLVKDALRWMSPGGEPFGDAYFGGVEVNPSNLVEAFFKPGLDAAGPKKQG